METLKIIKTLSELKELIQYISDNKKQYVAFDTETTGIDKNAEIIGYSICADIDVAYYVITAFWDVNEKKLKYLDTKQGSLELFKVLTQKRLIMHNGLFDIKMVEQNYKISLIDALFHDTMISGHLLNENRKNGLKERALELYGETSIKEQQLMKLSVQKNGGVLTKNNYELYKADADLIAHYGAKDAILTLKLFYEDVQQLYAEELDAFFYDLESMPQLKGPTYDLNTVGLKVDIQQLQSLKKDLMAECETAKAFIEQEIYEYVKDKYPGTGKTNKFNIGSAKQLAWLLFFRLNNDFLLLTKGGKDVCKALNLKLPYTAKARREFVQAVINNKGQLYGETWDKKKKKVIKQKKISDPWNYIACGKASLEVYQNKYKWVKKLLEYAKALKLLNTYVLGIENRLNYGIIYPSFLQHGTTSGRYSSKNPNFQNLPRDDKRIKSCIIARPNKVFVGADYSQLEPRVFASVSQDPMLLQCFEKKLDFYSVIGQEVFDKYDCSLIKDDLNSFAVLYPQLRQISKVIGLSTTYGTLAPKLAPLIKKSVEEADEIITKYFEKFSNVHKFMLESHEKVKNEGVVFNLYGRPRRMPEALAITSVYGNTNHAELPYDARNLLNLAVNHRIQSTGASIINRAMIKLHKEIKQLGLQECYIVLTVHDEIVIECLEKDAQKASILLQDCMENTITLPGVKLIAEPKIGKSLADLK